MLNEDEGLLQTLVSLELGFYLKWLLPADRRIA